MSDPRPVSRRSFLEGSAAALAAASLPGPASGAVPGSAAALRCVVVGVDGRGRANLDGVAKAGAEIVALCDVDGPRLASAGQRYPEAKRFEDFRAALELSGIEAVVVSTPDHTHANVAAAALGKGLDVYCEKPLAHDVAEVRHLTELAARKGAVTQLGTQIHAEPNYRRVVELVRSGAVGKVREVVVWCPKSWSPKGDEPVVEPPSRLAADLWLGPAPGNPFRQGMHPAGWRSWWDYGGGTLGDMGCHYIDLAFWALKLRDPLTVVAEGPPVDPFAAPKALKVTWTFAPSGDAPVVEGEPLTMRWHDGGDRPPEIEAMGLGDFAGGAVLFLGEDGRYLVTNYSKHRMGPQERFASFEGPEPFLDPSPGHYVEFVRACRERTTPSCDLSYSGKLNEAVLLGVVSHRLGGRPLEWDADRLQVVGCPEADSLVRRRPRAGWEIPGLD